METSHVAKSLGGQTLRANLLKNNCVRNFRNLPPLYHRFILFLHIKLSKLQLKILKIFVFVLHSLFSSHYFLHSATSNLHKLVSNNTNFIPVLKTSWNSSLCWSSTKTTLSISQPTHHLPPRTPLSRNFRMELFHICTKYFLLYIFGTFFACMLHLSCLLLFAEHTLFELHNLQLRAGGKQLLISIPLQILFDQLLRYSKVGPGYL